MRSSSSSSRRFERRPIASSTSFFVPDSPNSFTLRTVNVTMRSSPLCSISVMRPPTRCLRRSMQNMGGCAGFSAGSFVRWMRG